VTVQTVKYNSSKLNLALKTKHDKRFQEFFAILLVANQRAIREKKVYLSSYIYL